VSASEFAPTRTVLFVHTGQPRVFRFTIDAHQSWPSWQRHHTRPADPTATDDEVANDQRALPRSIEEFTSRAWHEAELPLHIPTLFVPAVINFYIHTGCPHLNGAGKDHRHMLLRQVRDTFRSRSAPRLPPITTRSATTPYTASEVTSIVSWARVQRTSRQRSDAHTLIALALGAGLTTTEIINTRAGDINHHHGINIVVAAGQLRTVPMLHAYEALLPTSDTRPITEFLFRRGRRSASCNTVANFEHRSVERQLHPVPARLRASWISTHLRNGTPLEVVAEAAGLSLGQLVARYRHLVPDPDDRQESLRYASTPP